MHAHAHPAAHGHVTPLGVYLAIFATLMVLTGVTVVVAYVDLGQANIFIALGIAGFKATLVVLYFMHVAHASRLTKLFAEPLLLGGKLPKQLATELVVDGGGHVRLRAALPDRRAHCGGGEGLTSGPGDGQRVIGSATR